ncbi:unnamed protein product [Phaedon cochleariae]|uniref:Echinoderm microtubule-associated protein-like 2 n=1 Tax=Phaedon cochleariae TaxID=80249 RepID=A0A9N9X341_PHACE|nr:unnamed protein product [Phaedon cochleariae]
MHLNGDSMESPDENHEMLEAENSGVASRMIDLERKVLEQGDELVCLKATLAEALRRLGALEAGGGGMGGAHLSFCGRPNGVSPAREPVVIRQRPQSYSASKVDGGGGGGMGAARRQFGSGSALPQRRAVHYQSTGSLHSDSQSSSSVSPIPSPSPRATPLPINGKRSANLSSPSSTISNNSALHKRWSSTIDFNQVAQNGMQSKTREAVFNDEDKTLKFFLRGRPVVLHAPTALADGHDLAKVSRAPSRRLKLDWAYGYRGRDCRSNLYSLPTGEMIYFVAGVVVLYDVEEQSQRHYCEHTDDVRSLAIHPNKMLIATGQCAGHDRKDARPHIRIWDSVSLHTQAVIGINDFDISVCCLSFSKADGGALLVAIDEAPDHTISVWEWQKGEGGHKITETKCSVDTIVSAEFHPLDRNTIVTCGKSHIAFWSLDPNGTLFKRMGIFEARDKPKYVTCVAFLQTGETITGDSNGNLAVWGRGTNTIFKFIKGVHEGSIFSICVLKDGSFVTGGGKDGRIVEFGANLAMTGVVSEVEGHFGGIRVISEGRGSQLLVGTTRNCILNGTAQLSFSPIILGHTDELWGLAVHPTLPQFATAGYDKVLQLWDSMSKTILWSKDIGEQAQSVAYSSDGSRVLVGCLTGLWMVFDARTRELLARHRDGTEAIQAIAFSPDGAAVALGSRDGHVYVYQVSEDGGKYARVGRCTGHSSFVTHIDWSVDNQTLRSNSGDYELLFWNAGTCRQIPQSGLVRDVEWASNTCPLTFTTAGVWPENADGTDVNACDRSRRDADLLVTADDFGKVKLYSYPVIQTKSLCHSYGGHSSHVTSVSFLYDDTRVVSIGGKDTAVLQWTVS